MPIQCNIVFIVKHVYGLQGNTGAVKACGLSDDCRHLSAVLGKGFIFRYEYRKPVNTVEPPAEDEDDSA